MRRPSMKSLTDLSSELSRKHTSATRQPSRPLTRRSFLGTALKTGAIFTLPQIVPAAVLGKDGALAPSERIVLGAIGIGNRGWYVLGCFLEEPDVQFVAVFVLKGRRRHPLQKRAG